MSVAVAVAALAAGAVISLRVSWLPVTPLKRVGCRVSSSVQRVPTSWPAAVGHRGRTIGLSRAVLGLVAALGAAARRAVMLAP